MTLVRYLLDAGPEGANATNSTSGSSASSLGGGTTAFAAAAAAQGPFGVAFTNVASSQTYRRWPFSAVTKTGQVSVVLQYLNPGVNLDVVALVNAAGNRRLSVRITSTGAVVLLDAASTQTTLIAAGVLTAGAKFRIALEFVGGSTTASTITAQAYALSGGTWNTAVGNAVSRTNANLNTDDLAGMEIGVMTAVASVQTVRADSIQMNDGAGSRIPDYSVAPAASPTYRWNGTAYVPLAAYRWNGSAYVPLDRATP